MILKTNGSDKSGTHWGKILYFPPKKDIFGLKNFVIYNDQKTIEKILIVVENIKRIDNKLIDLQGLENFV